MKAYRLLVKMNLRSLMSSLLGGGLHKDNGKLDISRVVLYTLAYGSLLFMLGFIIWMECTVFDAMASIGQQKLMLGLAIMSTMAVTLMFSLTHTFASMYFNRDAAHMAHLPITSRTIMAAKWTEIYLFEGGLSTAILLPLFVLYGLNTGAGVQYWISALLLLITSPMYPLAISMLLSSVLGRFTALMRHRETWIVIGTMLTVIVVVGVEMLLLPSIPEDADAFFFMRLIMNKEALLNLVIGSVPPVQWAVRALSGDWAMLLLSVAVAVSAVAIIIYTIGASYQQVTLLHSEHTAGTKRRKVKVASHAGYQQRSALMAIFRREMNEVFKVPTYLLNGALTVIMMPLVAVMMVVGVGVEEGADVVMGTIRDFIAAIGPANMILACAAVMSVSVWMTPVISTSVSREGKRLTITRMIPVPALTILNAKLLGQLILNAVSIAIMAIMLACFLGMDYLPQIAVGFVIANFVGYAVAAVNLTIDAIRPSLHWKNENEAMKQNMNQMIAMLVNTLMLLIVAAPPVWMIMNDVAAVWRVVSVIVTTALLCAVAFVLIRKVGAPRYEALEP